MLKTPIKPKREPAAERLERLLAFDEAIQDASGASVLIGVDEVGRGSLIGPVVTAAVSWRKNADSETARTALLGINDSKKLSPKKRAALMQVIPQFFNVALAEASPEDIEQLNLLQASLQASARAVAGLMKRQALSIKNCCVVMDGRDTLEAFPAAQQRAVIGGDTKSLLVAVASVYAKETRDAWVRRVAAEVSPEYGWAQNMGYATAQHRAALAELGRTPYHRHYVL